MLWKKTNDTIIHRKAGLGGIKDRVVNGHQFGKVPRKQSWPEQMKLHSIDCLCIYWFDTQYDDPVMIEHQLLAEYEEQNKELPVWNKQR